eukprot:5894519-Heterocapsa_arctica.AAC.1
MSLQAQLWFGTYKQPTKAVPVRGLPDCAAGLSKCTIVFLSRLAATLSLCYVGTLQSLRGA